MKIKTSRELGTKYFSIIPVQREMKSIQSSIKSYNILKGNIMLRVIDLSIFLYDK